VNEQGRITKNGQPFKANCGNWFGLEGKQESNSNGGAAPMELYVGNTNYANGGRGTGRTIQQTMNEIKAQGLNMVRLPISPQTLNPNDPMGRGSVLKNHASVRQTNARQAMEDFIKLADQNNIEVLVDIHSCSNYIGWRAGVLDAKPPFVDANRPGYDFNREGYSCAPMAGKIVHEYNETIWLENLREIARLEQKLGVDNIIGIDIFNEPWGYTWNEWKTLSEKAYQAISAVNPNTLVFVEGVSGQTVAGVKEPHGDEGLNPNWGENFFGAKANPLNIPKDRVVISPHTYGPAVFVQKHHLDPNQAQCAGLEGEDAGVAKCNVNIQANRARMEAGWEEHFGFLKQQGYAIVVGEFGGNMDWPKKTDAHIEGVWRHVTTNVDEQWQNAFVDYMKKKNIEACYWSVNPESADTGGWYGHAYDSKTNPSGWGEWLGFDTRKTAVLKRLWGN
jgi:endoglucanase